MWQSERVTVKWQTQAAVSARIFWIVQDHSVLYIQYVWCGKSNNDWTQNHLYSLVKREEVCAAWKQFEFHVRTEIAHGYIKVSTSLMLGLRFTAAVISRKPQNKVSMNIRPVFKYSSE